jgi:hypothetical protein
MKYGEWPYYASSVTVLQAYKQTSLFDLLYMH